MKDSTQISNRNNINHHFPEKYMFGSRRENRARGKVSGMTGSNKAVTGTGNQPSGFSER